MQLVIVESPTKAKTLGKFLGKDYKVHASRGHIRDLPKSGLGVDVEKDFDPEYVVPDKAKKTLRELKNMTKEADSIVLATDLDREGEAIAWHLYELLKTKKKDEKEFKRAVFHELTEEAVEEAFDHLGEINMSLVDAQQARRVLDRLVGYKLSPLLWKKVRYGLSAGRVQSVAVRLIVERERERDAFNPEEYWDIQGYFRDVMSTSNLQAELSKYKDKKVEINNENKAKEIEKELKDDSFEISNVKKSERKKSPYPPLKTSSLQQSMANMFGMSARKTMSAAQKLFEKGFITYHRTDSFNLSPQFLKSSRSYIKSSFGEEYLPKSPKIYKSKTKGAQEAHEAIRPTDIKRFPSKELKLTSDEEKVYIMIWRRALESQMKQAIYDRTTVTISSQKGYEFRATGSIVKFDGWMAVAKKLGMNGSTDLVDLPDLSEGDNMILDKMDLNQHFTQPPARYTDASLIKQLEELGIGRPSTYAPTISTILARKYVVRDGRSFVPTDVAYVVTDLLTKYFPNIVSYEFTAEMEEEFDEIAQGKKEWKPIIKDFYKPFEKELKERDKELSKTDVTTLETLDEKCPECGKPLVIKLGKYGRFISCSGYPECEYARPIKEDIPVDENGEEITDFGKCPECEDGVFILKRGRYGKFLACSNYPKCKTTKPYLEKIGVPCPKCQLEGKDGEVVIKKAKGRTFFGCSLYPECDFSSWKDPRNENFKYDPKEDKTKPKVDTKNKNSSKKKKSTSKKKSKTNKKPSKSKKK